MSYRSRVALRATITGVALLAMVGSGLAWAAYQNFTADIPHGAPVPALAAGQRDPDGADQNILLIGNDSRAGATPAELKALSTGDDGGSVNTDTIMVLHLPADGSKATVVSFPRDSWVTIPGHGKGKINSAYPDGYNAAKDGGADEAGAQSAGIILLIRTINALTGLHIDHYVQVSPLGFYRISNAIGGVPVCLLRAQNASTDSDEYGKGYSGIDLPAGWSTIKGAQALAFVRQRHGLPNGDLDRIKRQQYFLSAAFKKLMSGGVLLNPFKLRDLLRAVSSSLFTDPALDPIGLARQLERLSAGEVNYATIPNNGPQMIYPDGVATSIVSVDTAAMPGFFNVLRGKPADPALAAAKPAAASSVELDVLNGTTTTGLAGRNAAALRALGFHVNTVDSADATAATTVQYRPGQQSQAKAVAAAVPGAVLAETTSVPRVTLVLGTDGIQVRGLVSPNGDAQSPGVANASAAPTGASATGVTAAAAPSTTAAPGATGAPTATPPATTPAPAAQCIN